MALTAKKVYAILKRQISDMEAKLNSPVRYRGTVATADLLPLNPDIGDMYNIESKSVYGEAGMNVAWNGVVWDTMGAPIDMSLYIKSSELADWVKQQNKPAYTAEEVGALPADTKIPSKTSDLQNDSGFLTKIPDNYLSGTDKTLSVSGKAADAKAVGDKNVELLADILSKLDKNQGSENFGKIAGINESGDIVPMFPVSVDYNEETNCLEFGSDQKMELNKGINLDSTLTKTGYAADAGAVGEITNSLKKDIGNQNFRDVYQKVNLTFTSGGYYRQEKRFTEAYVEDAGFSYCIVPVLKGEKYICRGIDYYNARACLTWKGDGSTDNTPKEYPDVPHTVPNLGQYEFTIEENGVMVVNSRNLNGNNILYKYHNKNVNDKFDGKTVLFTGDSICNGYGWDVNEVHSNRKIICLTNPPEKDYNNLGWSQVFAENHRGCSVYSYGVNGTRITTTGPNTTDSILERIQKMNEDADYVILSGHMNDVFNKVELGLLTDVSVGNNSWKSATFATNTFFGALEKMFRDSILKWKTAKIGFIITPKNCNCMKAELYPTNQDAFVNAIIECCKKWCIPYLDLYHESGLVNALPDINSMYFSADQTHPNEKAYRERLSDLVESFMNRI